MDQQQFADFVCAGGYGLGGRRGAHEFRRSGLLRANRFLNSRNVKLAGIEFAYFCEARMRVYADRRILRRRREGWAGAFTWITEQPKYLILFFHPFRFHVTYRVSRVIDLRISNRANLLDKESV